MTTTTEPTLYFPCIREGKTGKISKKLVNTPMTRSEAEDFLKKNYRNAWLNLDAIPQPVGHNYFK